MNANEKEIRLPGLAVQIPAARRFVGAALGTEHPGRADAMLLTSETGTNAIAHSRSGLPGGSFLVNLRWTREWVRVSVTDEGAPDAPCLRRVGTGAVSGRGVALLDELSSQWGFSRWSAEGTQVWFVVGRAVPLRARNPGAFHQDTW